MLSAQAKMADAVGQSVNTEEKENTSLRLKKFCSRVR